MYFTMLTISLLLSVYSLYDAVSHLPPGGSAMGPLEDSITVWLHRTALSG